MAREKEVSAQEEREKEARAQEERREEHEGEEEMTTQEECVKEKKEMNSLQEDNDVSHRHMTWWTYRMVDPCGQWTTHADGTRPWTNLASSQEGSRTGSR